MRKYFTLARILLWPRHMPATALKFALAVTVAGLISGLAPVDEYYKHKSAKKQTEQKKCTPYGDESAGNQMCGYTK